MRGCSIGEIQEIYFFFYFLALQYYIGFAIYLLYDIVVMDA